MYRYYEYVDLSPQQVLQKVSQKQIFEWILGEEVTEGKLYRSPIRKDTEAGCRIDSLPNGDMIFTDFGDRVIHRSCFGLAMEVYEATLQSVVTKICDAFGLSTNEKDYTAIPIYFESNGELTRKTEIFYNSRNFRVDDRRYWNPYGIKEQELTQDIVFPVSSVTINNFKKNKRSSFRPKTVCYAIHVQDAVKLYQPYNAGYKFITNCTVNHIGNINNITTGDTLIIAKAYKDHRILRNYDRPNTIWTPSESIIPSIAILKDLCSRFKEIVVFFDNDDAGIEAGNKLIKVLDEVAWGIARMVYIPFEYKHKDLAEFRSKEGKTDTIQLLNQLRL